MRRGQMCVRCEWAHSCQRPSPSPGFRFKTNAALGNSLDVPTQSASWHRCSPSILLPVYTHTHTGKNLSVVGQKHTLPWPCQQLFASRPSRAVPNRTGKADAPPKFLCRLLLPIGKRIPCISRFGFASSLTVLAGVSSVVPSRADVCVSLFEFSLSHLPGNAFNYPRASYGDCAYLQQIFTR